MSYTAKPVFFFDPTNSTPQIKDAILSFSKGWLQKHSTNDELKLYHYTTLDGLRGIINTRSVWLTHVSTLNDPSELRYGENLILSLLKESIDKEHDENIISLIKYLTDFVKFFNSRLYHIYVACFCEAENLLSQWRAYGARGGGYNLGFCFNSKTKFYHSIDDEENGSIILRKIIYDLAEQKKLISDYISSIIKSSNDAIEYFKENKGIPDAWSAIASVEAVNILIDLMLSFKNPVFKEEGEWRLIKCRQGNFKPEHLRFRETKSGLVPYIETYIYENQKEKQIFPLISVKFGPTLDEGRTNSSIQLFLNKESVSNSEISIDAQKIVVTGAGYLLRK